MDWQAWPIVEWRVWVCSGLFWPKGAVMTTPNTASDAANTAVRAYLTSLGEKYLGHGFNTGSGKGKRIWLEIQESFQKRCAYCDQEASRLTIEHLIPFNRESGGLHHPGNIVPCCSTCNRRRKENGLEVDWRTHLTDIIERDNHGVATLRMRQKRIEEHMQNYDHPKLTDDEVAAISTIAKSLYAAVSTEVKRGTDLYWAIHQSMISKAKS